MSNPPPMRVSLICTVRDEADNIAALLDSMLAQTRQPDEIIINDCQSRDATPTIVQQYAARHAHIRLVTGGHNISSGRNHAIAHATGQIIASTDAGLVLDPHWLERLIAPLEQGRADQTGGFYCPQPHSLFELVLGATNYRSVAEIDPARFLPFGNCMAFRREAWAAVGGFPEWLSHCEDIVFDLALEQAGYQREFVPDAVIMFRPRASLRAFFRQYYFYARGDGIAGLWTKRHLIRYATYSWGSLLVVKAIYSPRWRMPVALLGILGTIAYTRAPYRRLMPQLRQLRQQQPIPRTHWVNALLLVPVIRVVGDLAKMLGYPRGRWLRHTHPAHRKP